MIGLKVRGPVINFKGHALTTRKVALAPKEAVLVCSYKNSRGKTVQRSFISDRKGVHSDRAVAYFRGTKFGSMLEYIGWFR